MKFSTAAIALLVGVAAAAPASDVSRSRQRRANGGAEVVQQLQSPIARSNANVANLVGPGAQDSIKRKRGGQKAAGAGKKNNNENNNAEENNNNNNAEDEEAADEEAGGAGMANNATAGADKTAAKESNKRNGRSLNLYAARKTARGRAALRV
ncbi:hypothetical protein LX36DRAFT_701858 [Colletotrichum falcatum]|nr:hypothetical protein LX36DRAFT_701858 [Colletotrichum falcatum]